MITFYSVILIIYISIVLTFSSNLFILNNEELHWARGEEEEKEAGTNQEGLKSCLTSSPAPIKRQIFPFCLTPGPLPSTLQLELSYFKCWK